MKRIVIIGGGFAGSHTAQQLEKEFDVTLIDTKDYFEFTPGILRAIVEPEHVKNLQVLHTHYLQRAKTFRGKVSTIDGSTVTIGKIKIPYDYLVISSGSRYNTPFKEGHIITALRAQNLRNQYDTLCQAKKVLIVGGGLVGVELAGEICWKYRHQTKEITIVHSKDRLIERNNQHAVHCAEKYLKKKGVTILYNQRVIRNEKDTYITDTGNRIEADITFLCTGIKPNYSFMDQHFKKNLNKKNHIQVNQNLQLKNHENIFACGDISDQKEEKTAQNAERQAHIIVQNIRRLEKGKKLCAYKPRSGPLIISLGKNFGIFTYKNHTYSGYLPAKMKSIIEWREMRKKR